MCNKYLRNGQKTLIYPVDTPSIVYDIPMQYDYIRLLDTTSGSFRNNLVISNIATTLVNADVLDEDFDQALENLDVEDE